MGYRLHKDELLCRYCGNHYSIDSLKVGKMSCFPIKLPFKLDRRLLRLQTSELKRRADYFPPQSFLGKPLSFASDWF